MKAYVVIALALFLGSGQLMGAEEKADTGSKKVAPEKSVSGGEDKVFVTVNGEKVMMSRVNNLVAPAVAQMKKRGREVAGPELDKMRRRAAESIIMDKLVGEGLKAAKLEVTDVDIKSTIEEEAKRRGVTYEKFVERRTSSGLTMEDLKVQVRSYIGKEKLIEFAMGKELKPMTEKEAKKFYSENIPRYTREEEVRASHILLKIGTLDAAGKAEAKAKLEGILGEIKGGADFAELAKTHSACPSSAKGGDLDFFTRARMVKPFSDAAFAMKKGEVSDVVDTRFGYHIIKVTDRKEAGVQSFDEVKDSIVEMQDRKSKQDFATKYIREIWEGATIAWAEEAKPKQTDPLKKEDPSKM